MNNFEIGIKDNFEGNKIKSSIEFSQGNSNSNSEDRAMNYWFTIKISKEYLEDLKTLRYISNLMKHRCIHKNKRNSSRIQNNLCKPCSCKHNIRAKFMCWS